MSLYPCWKTQRNWEKEKPGGDKLLCSEQSHILPTVVVALGITEEC
jgi:hypothetical protein